MSTNIRKMGCFEDPKDERDIILGNYLNYKKVAGSLEGYRANRVDRTDKMTPVKDQGNLGSCVGFAVAAMKEYQQRIERLNDGKDDKVYDLSEQWIYQHAKKIDPWPNAEGTSIRCGLKIVHNKGVPPEHAWPYDDTNIGDHENWAPMIARWGISKKYYRANNISEVLDALQFVGPVVIGIKCFREFFEVGNDGVVPMPANPDQVYGLHAICLAGFDMNKRWTPFKNSWGTGWGDNGWGYLPFPYITKYATDCWVSVDKEATIEDLEG